MKAYLIRRLLLTIPTFFGISLITFFAVQLVPGNPIFLRLQTMQGAMGADQVPDEIIEQTKKLYGFDKPLPVRYVLWLGRLVRLDFGDSHKDNRPVLEKIVEYGSWKQFLNGPLCITLQISITSLILLYFISIPLGVYSGTHRGTKTDSGITVGLFLLYSLPSFWVAMLLMYFLGGSGGSHSLHEVCAGLFEFLGIADWDWVQWLLVRVLHFNWFPIYGFSSLGAHEWPFHKWLLDRIWHLALPVFCMTYAGFAYTSRYMRAGIIDVVGQDYIRTARAYGFSERTVIYRYGLRNALIPILTLLGEELPLLIGGSVIIETIFSIPGMGRMSFEAILFRDYPLIMGILSFTAFLTLAGLILSDILYALVDPRIKFE